MRMFAWPLAIFTSLFVLALSAAPAHAQATRTWVSGVGDDANPCSRTAPCKTFAGAISKTAAGGEINCLDPGGFGAVTVIKSMTISCEAGTAGVLVSGSNGIVFAGAATDYLFLKGLDIEGFGTAVRLSRNPNVQSGGFLHVEDCVIRDFKGATAMGIQIMPSNSAKFEILRTTLFNNGTGVTGAGIQVRPTCWVHHRTHRQGHCGLQCVRDRRRRQRRHDRNQHHHPRQRNQWKHFRWSGGDHRSHRSRRHGHAHGRS